MKILQMSQLPTSFGYDIDAIRTNLWNLKKREIFNHLWNVLHTQVFIFNSLWQVLLNSQHKDLEWIIPISKLEDLKRKLNSSSTGTDMVYSIPKSLSWIIYPPSQEQAAPQNKLWLQATVLRTIQNRSVLTCHLKALSLQLPLHSQNAYV